MATVWVDDRVGRLRVDAFGVTTTATGAHGAFVVSAYGDVDLVTAPELERELLGAVRLGARRVLVDLTRATFFDSSAIHTLLRSDERLRADGLQLDVICSNPNVARVLEITGAYRDLKIHSTIDQAIGLTVAGGHPVGPSEPSYLAPAESYA